MPPEAAAAAEQETQEQIEARLKQEAIDAGDVFDPADGRETGSGAPVATGQKQSEQDPEIDPETLAAIAGEDKPKTVPHSRFNEVNEENKANRARVLELEEQLARAKGSAPADKKTEPEQPQAYDFDDAEERYSAALLDGDQTLAKQIRGEIRKQEQDAADKRAEAAADRRYKESRQQDDEKRVKLEFDLALAKAYEAHPFLNNDSDQANHDAIDEVLVWHQSYVSKGKTPAEALAAAVEKVAPRYAKKPEETAQAPKPDLKQAIDRANKVPPRPGGVGERASELDVSKMSAKDIKALSPEDEARLAGNFV